jgi:hypothetical protein
MGLSRKSVAVAVCVASAAVFMWCMERHLLTASAALLSCGLSWQWAAWWLDGVVLRNCRLKVFKTVAALSELGKTIGRGSLLFFLAGIVEFLWR